MSRHATIPDGFTRLQSAEKLARESGFRRLTLGVGEPNVLPVAAWFRPGSKRRDRAPSVADVHVYIEGDGLAWKSRREPSEDPTPLRPIALMLAVADPTTANILYLGRPCQYAMPPESGCRPIFWTAARFGDAVIRAMNRNLTLALDRADLGKAASIELVGYSGGGVIAALLAARRHDIRLLVTIAAPLNVEAWTKQARVSSLPASRSPMDEIGALRKIRQHHFAGRDDRRVPVSVIRSFHLALGESARSQLTIVDAIDHHEWPGVWPSLVRRWEPPD